MPAARLPDDEQQRQSALDSYHIVDTAPDQRFDLLADLARDLFGMPVALVSLIDRDRQWFKTALGLDAKQTPRAQAFCAHAILCPDEVLVVPDAALDPRFADNALVTGETGIRFYAGAPIRGDDGHGLGTLCLIDKQPRELDADGRRRLQALAASVGALMELHRKTLQLHEAATRDPLTGLGNRRSFEVQLASAVEQALSGLPCALLALDLDGFKAVNDARGHVAGDAVLREVAGRISAATRAADLVARVGGDEFTILASGPIATEQARSLADRVLQELAAPFALDGEAVALSASIGVALCPADAIDAAGLARAADDALHAAKRTGRGAARLAGEPESPRAEPPAASAVRLRQRPLQNDLRDAIEDGALRLHWQPYVDMDTLAVAGHEALCRWTHPVRGAIPPSVFVPLAENSGLIARLDGWVMRAACAAAAAWPGDQRVSVNLSPYWFGRGDALGLVQECLSASGLPASRLTVELTERTLIEHHDAARSQIVSLQATGVRVALDDFGVGYASLRYLASLPIDVVKLDRAFVALIGTGPRPDSVARLILQMGRALGVTVCAEGVETQEQLDFIRREGGSLVQGFLLARPAGKARHALARSAMRKLRSTDEPPS
jgi:diguanylate cyclase (GGDEF)-like protein